VVVLSAQFPDLDKIARWVDGTPIESDWTPTWLERFVYFSDSEGTTGLLQGEIGDPAPCLTLSKTADAESGTCSPGRPQPLERHVPPQAVGIEDAGHDLAEVALPGRGP
jgi:hypothetical protein